MAARIKTAEALRDVGYTVEFLPVSDHDCVKTADITVDGERFEMKAPRGDKLASVERNLKRASHQSHNIVIDSRRLKRIHDTNVQRFLASKLKR